MHSAERVVKLVVATYKHIIRRYYVLSSAFASLVGILN